MRFWIPVLTSLFAALYIMRIDPGPSGMMTGLVASLTGLDVAGHLSK
jgi:hypothetical protein